MQLLIVRGCRFSGNLCLSVIVRCVPIALLAISLASCGAILNTGIHHNGDVQIGMASWYGRYFHGRITTCGERYNMYKATAAHRTLPFGTLVRVKNLKNDKTVIVRINDRGPWISDRVIDLSYGAAKKLDMVADGVARVRIELIKEQAGKASWYGKPFHGKTTASGEIYDMNQLTAAHPILPFGSLVKVTNIENSASVTVRINDRMPESKKRVINLSRKAAEKLDMLKSGVATVIVDMPGAAPKL